MSRLIYNKEKTFLLLFGITSFLCIASLFVADKDQLLGFYKRFGFDILFFTTAYWAYSLLPERFPGRRHLTFRWQSHGIILLSLLVTGLMFLVSHIQFRILADETNLVSVSYSMFMGHSFSNVTDSLYFYQQHEPLNATLDIRPSFYPFLIYLVHVVKGYSAYDGFVVNFFAGTACLACMYSLLSQWFRWQIALLGMLILAAFPVYVLWVTSSGFEILNLALALFSFILLNRYLENRENKDLERLLLTLVLLAQTRYESAVFVLAIGIVLLVSFRKRYFASLPMRLLVIPWLFLPIAWHRLIKTDKADYQVYGDDQIFSLDNWLKNIGSSFDYFTASNEWYGTIEPVFYLALAGFLLAAVRIFLGKARLGKSAEYVFLAAALSFLGLVVVVFAYYWGNLTLVFTIRLGIIFLPFMVVSVCYLVDEIISWFYRADYTTGLSKFLVVAGISLIVFYWPVAARNEAVEKLTLNRLYQNTLGFLQKEFPDHNNLVVTDRPGMYTVHQWGAVSVEYANKKYRKIINGLKRKLYQNVLFIQEVNYKTGLATETTALPEAFKLETLFETQFDATRKLRISRLVVE